MFEDSETCLSGGSSSQSASPSLLSNLRQFRFQKKAMPKMNIHKQIARSATHSEETPCADSFDTPEITAKPRKKVRRLEMSDEEEDEPITAAAANTDDDEPTTVAANTDDDDASANRTEQHLRFLQDAFPDRDKMELQDALASNDWNPEAAMSSLCNSPRKDNHINEPVATEKHSSKHRKKFKRRRLVSGGSSDGEDQYQDNRVFDSSDSDPDLEDSRMTKSQKNVLEFLSTATEGELRAMPNCSMKKALAVAELRPFDSWRQLVEKLRTNRAVSCDILNAAHDVLCSRAVVQKLMKKCVGLATQMERAVAEGGTDVTSQPCSIAPGLQLANYQLVGLNWLITIHNQGLNGILADEMGLGKTVQVIAFLAYLQETGASNEGPHLIIVPSSTLENWSNELARWCPSLRVVVYYGSQEERRALRFGWNRGELDDVDVILTTYSVVGSNPEERKMFRLMTLEYVVLDEAHMVKNMATQRYDNLMRINGKHRVLLTGTPLQNSLLELMSLLIFVMPHMFHGKKDYLKSLFVSKTATTSEERQANKSKPRFEQAQVAQARRIMKPFVLRRLKRDVLKDLPAKTEETISCTMLGRQRAMYRDLVEEYSRDTAVVVKGEIPSTNGMTMMMQLRKLANHPTLLQQHYTSADLSKMAKCLSTDMLYKQTNIEHIVEDLTYMSDFEIHQMTNVYKGLNRFKLPESVILDSGKFKKLDDLLPKLKSEGHRVLLFSQFVIMLDVLEEYLRIRKHTFIRLDGSTAVNTRQQLIDDFNRGPGIFVFLLSTRAGGLGINLTAADTVLLHDIDFNPYNDKQAEDRCHRLGQKRPVSVIRLISSESIEEGIFEVAQEKLNLEKEINSAEDGEPAEAKNVVRLLKQALGLENKSSSPIKAS